MRKQISIPGRWRNIRYFHFPIPAQVLQALLPQSVEVIEFGGIAWLTLVYFLSENLYRGIAFASYNGLNVRTYVRPRDGGPVGVYFLKLLTDSLIVDFIGKTLRLPYEQVLFSMDRMESPGEFPDETIVVTPADYQQTNILLNTTFQRTKEPSPHAALARQLSDQQYGYHAAFGKTLIQLEVRHPAFDLQPAEIVTEDTEPLFEADPIFKGLGLTSPMDPPLVFCSEGGMVEQLVPRLHRLDLSFDTASPLLAR